MLLLMVIVGAVERTVRASSSPYPRYEEQQKANKTDKTQHFNEPILQVSNNQQAKSSSKRKHKTRWQLHFCEVELILSLTKGMP